MQSLKTRLESLQAQIATACQAAGRPTDSVTLLAVSKTWPVPVLQAAIDAGQHRFGENYLQEALPKIQALAGQSLEWHFIGPMQSNKTRDIAEHFDWVHSVDRIKIAKRLDDQRPAHLPPLQVCVQINIDQEATKSGVDISELPALLEAIQHCSHLRLRGFMILPNPASSAQSQSPFARAAALLQGYQAQYPTLDTLSMGMSDDLSEAIKHGSTLVRVGSALFGTRQARE